MTKREKRHVWHVLHGEPALLPGGTAGLGFARARCNLIKPLTSGTAGAGAGTATGRRLVLAAGNVFASKHQTRQVSPVSQPALAVELQLGLHLAPTAPVRPLCLNVLS